MSTDDPNRIVRATARAVEEAASRTRRAGFALVAVISLLVLGLGAVTARNAVRLTDIIERQQRQTAFNERLLEEVRTFNEAHAKAAGQSFDAIVSNIRCAATSFYAPDPEAALDACYRPSPPQPTPGKVLRDPTPDPPRKKEPPRE